ncbi:putative beta-glucosidase [Escovopsis weberi]|uniref:Probable beta-glucosidase btgE n=1 Tax=Escovopsis weberi TaxID=150374 RepID=A0A0M8N917_ESCWE|nr:putative beta-glucosidase [Escovopsis weberi]
MDVRPPPIASLPGTAGIVAVPTPIAYTFTTPGTYTLPAKVATLTDTTTISGEASATLLPGDHTVGGVTTTVDSAVVVTIPVATSGTILPATYACPSAGTYIVNPILTTVTQPTIVVYPTPTSYLPGTYTAPEQVVTVTDANQVAYCSFTSAEVAPPEPTGASNAAEPDGVPEEASEPNHLHARGALVSSNDHLGITYTPYDPNSGACKSGFQVEQDIAKFKAAGFSVVRVYSTDCSTLQSVGGAVERHGMKMIIGIFIGSPGSCSADSASIRPQIDAIAAWGKWNLVELFVVGNEAIMNGFCSPGQLRDLIKAVKGRTSYRGPYTTSETLNIWQRGDVSGALCGVVDMTGANIHAYFTPSVVPSQAGDFVAGEMNALSGICPGKPSINLESGWPTDGQCNGSACPGKEQQRQAFQSLRQKVGSRTVFFSYENDLWKAQGSCGCEKSWGAKALFGL